MTRFVAWIGTVLLLMAAVGCAGSDDTGTTGAGGNGGGEGECGDGTQDAGEECDDGNGIGGDGCSAFCGLEEICGDGLDNDGDGQSDCDDSGCGNHPSCQGDREDCGTPGDEDGDGAADCADSECAAEPACLEEELCDNPGDEDGDGATDCDDPDCAAHPACVGSENCTTPGDEDDNGAADCEDVACATHPSCVGAEDCQTPGDEDGNALADCDDPACSGQGDCPVAGCGDGVLQDDEGELCDDGPENSDGDPNACREDCTLPICGDGVVDDDRAFGELCDTGALLNDRAPNACREDCTFPACGDGVVDSENPDPTAVVPHEDCDGGDNCGPDCKLIDVSVACGPDSVVEPLLDFPARDVAGTPIPNTYYVSGQILALESELEPVVGCVPDDEGGDPVATGGERIFTFEPDVSGDWVARTNLSGTRVNTVVYVRSNCAVPTGEVCNDDAFGAFGSQTVWSADAGRSYFIVVDTLGDESGDFELIVRPVETAGPGEACGDGVLCTDGACANVEGSPRCITDPAPVQSSFEIDLLMDQPDERCGGDNIWLMRFRSRGTDQDRNIETMDYFFTDSTEPNPPESQRFIFVDAEEVPVEPAFLANYEGGAYDAVAFVLSCDLVQAGFVRWFGGAIDAAGHVTDLIDVDLTLLELVPTRSAGNDCDPTFWADQCAETTFCQNDGDGSFSCGNRSTAPVLSGLEVLRLSQTELRVVANGIDPEGDTTGLSLRITDATGAIDLTAALSGSSPFPLDLTTPPTGDSEWRRSTDLFFSAPVETVAVDVGGELVVPGRVYARVIDSQGNLSAAELFAGIPQLAVGDVGEGCDATGGLDYCLPHLICRADQAGDGVCDEPELALRNFDVVFLPDSSEIGAPAVPGYLFFFQGESNAVADPLGGVLQARVSVMGFPPPPESRLTLKSQIRFAGELDGQTQFLLVGWAEDQWAGTETHFDGVLLTDGLAFSNARRAGLLPIRRNTQPCDMNRLANVCDVGTTCVEGTCGAAVAPVLEDLEADRDSLEDIGFFAGGSDVEADVVGFEVDLTDSDGFAVILPGLRFPFDESMFGFAEFVDNGTDERAGGHIDWGATPPDPALLSDIGQLTVWLVDSAGLLSEPLTVGLYRGEGKACDPADVPCATGLSCLNAAETGPCAASGDSCFCAEP